jgi:hypothetical protein
VRALHHAIRERSRVLMEKKKGGEYEDVDDEDAYGDMGPSPGPGMVRLVHLLRIQLTPVDSC